MKKITVSSPTRYDILIGHGLINCSGKYIRQITKSKKAIIISDSNVWPLYGEVVKSSLEAEGFEVFYHCFAAGEPSKKLDTVNGMLGAMSKAELTRGDIAVALGGGVAGDMAGFASAIYLRGIDFVQIPTTLLSQVDSSVGGKTGCDTDFGKNLVGAFHNPKLVLIDTDTLDTLPDRYVRDGMGEVVKYGCIKSEKLFKKLEQAEDIKDSIDEIVFECVDIKRQVVENDFTEKGERMLLNFGHTLAHAIEKYQNYEGVAHGEAVAVGMYEIAKASERAGETEEGTAERIKNLLSRYSLPTSAEVSMEQLTEIMLYDKKRRGDEINLVMLRKIGDSFVKPLKTEKLKDFFAE